MRLVDKPLAIGLCGHVDVTSDMKMTHYVSGLISDITVKDSVKTLRSEFVGLHINTTNDTTILRLQSGDFIVKVDGSGNYEQLLKQITVFSDSASAQYAKNIIDQPALRRLLPTLKMHVESKRENPLVTILKSQDVDFKQLLFDMDTSPATGVNGNGYVHSLTYDDIRLDTIIRSSCSMPSSMACCKSVEPPLACVITMPTIRWVPALVPRLRCWIADFISVSYPKRPPWATSSSS